MKIAPFLFRRNLCFLRFVILAIFLISCRPAVKVLPTGEDVPPNTPAREEVQSPASGPSKVEVRKAADGSFTLLRNGQPYFVKGVGGFDIRLDLLAQCGGNSIRTWGIDSLVDTVVDGRTLLDHCQELGFTIAAGLVVKHERHGFDYSDPKFVRRQRETIREAVRKYKDHPAILVWCLGNEMDGPLSDGANSVIWKEVNELAAIVKQEDPHHPVMTAVGGLSPLRLEYIRKHYPNLDILGVNTYGKATLIPEMLREAGWDKPFIVTEFGPSGHWEVRKTPWGAPIEQSSRQKAASYAAAQKLMTTGAKETCLGTYAFLWGNKQEVTSTWYSMLLPAGEKLPVVDAMARAWSGEWPANRCPEMESFTTGLREATVEPNAELSAQVKVSDPDQDALAYEWTVMRESTDVKEGGDFEKAPDAHPECIVHNGNDGTAVVKVPSRPGAYRLFVTVRDGKGSAVSENVPFLVRTSLTKSVGEKDKGWASYSDKEFAED